MWVLASAAAAVDFAWRVSAPSAIKSRFGDGVGCGAVSCRPGLILRTTKLVMTVMTVGGVVGVALGALLLLLTGLLAGIELHG